MRHLYTLSSIPQPQKDSLIAMAKNMERRRCNHHTLDNPLSTLDCVSSVIDPKKAGANKAHVVVASQHEEVRRWCRGVKGVPLVYVKRSVMIMEPMSDGSASVREGIERGKFRTGLRGRGLAVGAKRKREEVEEDEGGEEEERVGRDIEVNKARIAENDDQREDRAMRKKIRGPKGPNPLSVKKSKPTKDKADNKPKEEDHNLSTTRVASFKVGRNSEANGPDIIEGPLDEAQNPPVKRKRKRKHKADKVQDLKKELDAPEPEDARECVS